MTVFASPSEPVAPRTAAPTATPPTVVFRNVLLETPGLESADSFFSSVIFVGGKSCTQRTKGYASKCTKMHECAARPTAGHVGIRPTTLQIESESRSPYCHRNLACLGGYSNPMRNTPKSRGQFNASTTPSSWRTRVFRTAFECLSLQYHLGANKVGPQPDAPRQNTDSADVVAGDNPVSANLARMTRVCCDIQFFRLRLTSDLGECTSFCILCASHRRIWAGRAGGFHQRYTIRRRHPTDQR